jgi:hypothetical protein
VPKLAAVRTMLLRVVAHLVMVVDLLLEETHRWTEQSASSHSGMTQQSKVTLTKAGHYNNFRIGYERTSEITSIR